MQNRGIFENISPIDYRYWDKEVAKYLSEEAFVRYKLLVELALVKVFHKRGFCDWATLKEIEEACALVRAKDVYKEEEKTRHDIRALVNCIQARVGDKAKPFVHMTATSYDIIDTANALRYGYAVNVTLLPTLLQLEKCLIDITAREAETIQIGRTHGQHAVPITFGFAMAEYVSRLGRSIEKLMSLTFQLPGKFSGAVGAYNASSLFFGDPEEFEREVLNELGLKPLDYSTQIVQSEPFARLFCEIVIAAGVMANLADDMRHLQRTEIGEVGEEFEDGQVGSSTMPQKQNPVNFENSKSCWKIVMPRLMTVFMDQISEHQRDLTGSASARTYGEMIAYTFFIAKRLKRVMSKLKVDRNNLKKNFESQGDLILAEPLYIILASLGHPNAHEKVKQLTFRTRLESKTLRDLIEKDVELAPYLEKITPYQKEILSNPSKYTGIAAKKAELVAKEWQKRLGL